MNNISAVTISGKITATGEMSGTVQITGEPVLDSVTVKSTGVSQTIVPEQGVDGYNEITVSPLDMETVTVKSNSSTIQTVVPSQGKDGISSVSVEPILLQSKSVTPGACAIVVTPDSAFDGLSSVEVAAAPSGEGFVLDFSVSWHGVIENFMFQNQTQITGVTFKINNADLTIGRSAFQGCRNITRLEIPVCQSIGSNAFNGVSGHDVYLGASTQYGSAVIPIGQAYDIGEPASIHVPFEMLNTYKNDSAWGAFASIMVGDYIVP